MEVLTMDPEAPTDCSRAVQIFCEAVENKHTAHLMGAFTAHGAESLNRILAPERYGAKRYRVVLKFEHDDARTYILATYWIKVGDRWVIDDVEELAPES